jgi:hypothetical protein
MAGAKPVVFVAKPEDAPSDPDQVYARAPTIGPTHKYRGEMSC